MALRAEVRPPVELERKEPHTLIGRSDTHAITPDEAALERRDRRATRIQREAGGNR